MYLFIHLFSCSFMVCLPCQHRNSERGRASVPGVPAGSSSLGTGRWCRDRDCLRVQTWGDTVPLPPSRSVPRWGAAWGGDCPLCTYSQEGRKPVVEGEQPSLKTRPSLEPADVTLFRGGIFADVLKLSFFFFFFFCFFGPPFCIWQFPG